MADSLEPYNLEESLRNFGIKIKQESQLMEDYFENDDEFEEAEMPYEELDDAEEQELMYSYQASLSTSNSAASSSSRSRNRKQQLSALDRDDSMPEEMVLEQPAPEPSPYTINFQSLHKRKDKPPLYVLNPNDFPNDPVKQYQIRRAVITYRHHQEKKKLILQLQEEKRKLLSVIELMRKRDVSILEICSCPRTINMIQESIPKTEAILQAPLAPAPPLPEVPPLPPTRKQQEKYPYDSSPLMPKLEKAGPSRRNTNNSSPPVGEPHILNSFSLEQDEFPINNQPSTKTHTAVSRKPDPPMNSTAPKERVIECGKETMERIQQIVKNSQQRRSSNNNVNSTESGKKDPPTMKKPTLTNGTNGTIPVTQVTMKQEPVERMMTVSEMFKAQKQQLAMRNSKATPPPPVNRSQVDASQTQTKSNLLVKPNTIVKPAPKIVFKPTPPPSATIKPTVQSQPHKVQVQKPASFNFSKVVIKNEPVDIPEDLEPPADEIPITPPPKSITQRIEKIPLTAIVKPEPIDEDEVSPPNQRRSRRAAAINRPNAREMLQGFMRKASSSPLKTKAGLGDDDDDLEYARPLKQMRRK